MRVYCCTRLAQRSTTFCFSKFLFLGNPGSVMDYVLKMSLNQKNIILIRKCYWDLLLHSPSTTQQIFLFYKIPIFVKSRVGDGLCISKMSLHLENINLIRKCDMGLLLYSPRKTQQNFYFLKYYVCVSNIRDINI